MLVQQVFNSQKQILALILTIVQELGVWNLDNFN